MEVIAKGKYINISPKKARPVADLVRGKGALEARVILSNMPQSSAREIIKVLESAIANAENNFSLEKEELTIQKISIDGGPIAKRYQPRAKGSASMIKRRTSHIEVVLKGEIKTRKVSEKGDSVKKEIKHVESQENSKKPEITNIKEKFSATLSKESKAPKMFRRKTGQ
jgi:large subunit ribosomal protein L22